MVVEIVGAAARRLVEFLAQAGPSTVATMAAHQRTSATAVRRPLKELVDHGFVEAHAQAPFGPSPERGRGRPSQVYGLTAAGRSLAGASYEDLAVTALTYLHDHLGDAAVRDFAETRAARIVPERVDSLDELIEVMSVHGVTGSVEPGPGQGQQVCLHHCPVEHAARHHPQICEAETAAMSSALGRPVVRLATLGHGDAVCTLLVGEASHGLSESLESTAQPRRVPA